MGCGMPCDIGRRYPIAVPHNGHKLFAANRNSEEAYLYCDLLADEYLRIKLFQLNGNIVIFLINNYYNSNESILIRFVRCLGLIIAAGWFMGVIVLAINWIELI